MQLLGGAVGISGNLAVISALESFADGKGAAYVFESDRITWSVKDRIVASGGEAGDEFASAVAISGDTIVVGAPNEDSAATEVNGNRADDSASDAGAAYVFVRRSVKWIEQAYLKPPTPGPGDRFGNTVAISGDTIVVGAPYESGAASEVGNEFGNTSSYASGAAYVYVRVGAEWVWQAYLKASNSDAGDRFGHSVAIWGDTIVVGAISEDSISTGVNGHQSRDISRESGAAYVFVRDGKTWRQQAYLKASNTAVGDHFGSSVAVSGDTVVVGAPSESSNATGVDGVATARALNSGAAYVFTREDSIWSQSAYLKSPIAGRHDRFGHCVAVSGITVVVGAEGEDDRAGHTITTNAGAAYAFEKLGDGWVQSAHIKASNADATDGFGISIAVSGTTVLVGANGEDSKAVEVDGDGADNSMRDSGTAYVFERPFPVCALSSIKRTSGCTLLTMPPAFGHSVGVEYSPDFSPGSWIELGNMFIENEEWYFVDPDPVRRARRSGYYRIFERPRAR